MSGKGKKSYSRKWTLRSKTLRDLVDHCVICMSRERLVVHHLVYKSGGRGSDLEKPEDMVVLCAVCHDDLHYEKALGRYQYMKFRARRRRDLDALSGTSDYVFRDQ